jgi:hypothetical protein
MFRGLALVATMPFLIGCNAYVWSLTGVNYVLIFNLNPRRFMSYRDLTCLGAGLMAIWAVSALGYAYNHLVVTFPNPYRALLEFHPLQMQF